MYFICLEGRTYQGEAPERRVAGTCCICAWYTVLVMLHCIVSTGSFARGLQWGERSTWPRQQLREWTHDNFIQFEHSQAALKNVQCCAMARCSGAAQKIRRFKRLRLKVIRIKKGGFTEVSGEFFWWKNGRWFQNHIPPKASVWSISFCVHWLDPDTSCWLHRSAFLFPWCA